VRDWPWADCVDEELRQQLVRYGEGSLGPEPRELSFEVHGDSDDGSFRARLTLDETRVSGRPMIRIRVTTSEHKFGSGRSGEEDAGALTEELCQRHSGRELSPDPAGGWSFLVDGPSVRGATVSSGGSRRSKLWSGVKSLALWVLVLGPAVPIAGSLGVWSGIARQFHRPCSQHAPCSPGFCDRGRCMLVEPDRESRFGSACSESAACGEFACVDGRCSSCETNEECHSKPGVALSCDRSKTLRACRNRQTEPYAGP
jgi:hypothetical protein